MQMKNFASIRIFYLYLSLVISNVLTLKYGNKTFDEWTWLTAHNSHVNWEDSGTIDALVNQNLNIEKQLEYGVRGFLFDIDWKNCSNIEKIFGTCICEGINSILIILIFIFIIIIFFY